MFGYVRPNKGELLVKEYARYKSIYCGICKAIKKNYGSLNTLAITYDMTFFALFYLSLSDDDANSINESCSFNPFKKGTVLNNHESIEKAASLSMIFAYLKIMDDIRDEKAKTKKIINKFQKSVFEKSFRKATDILSDESDAVYSGLEKLNISEKIFDGNSFAYKKNAKLFGEILGNAFKLSFSGLIKENESIERSLILEGIELIGIYLGRWIYIIDAIEDFDTDKSAEKYNPFFPLTKKEAMEKANTLLIEYEKKLDLTAALLPYRRDGGIISNILTMGLQKVREEIWQGKKLTNF